VKRLLSVVMVLACGCTSVRPVPVEAALSAPEDGEGARVVQNVKVVVIIPAEVEARGGKPVEPKPTRVDFTSTQAEEYPSRAHMEKTIPMALREAGFDVVPVPTLEAAKATGVPLIIQLADPQVEGFRRASGGGVSLEGTVYDVHVHYRARLTTSQGAPLTDVAGHGQSSANFRFDDKYLETAVVGGVSLVLMTLITGVISLPLVAYLAFTGYQQRNEPLSGKDRHPARGLVTCEGFRGNPLSGQDNESVCNQVVWLSSVLAVAVLTVGVAAVTLFISKTVGGWIFKGTTGGIKSYLSEGVWKDMLQSAHNRAARSFAAGAARAVLAPQKPAAAAGRAP